MKTYHIFDFELVFKKGKFKLYDKKSLFFHFWSCFVYTGYTPGF